MRVGSVGPDKPDLNDSRGTRNKPSEELKAVHPGTCIRAPTLTNVSTPDEATVSPSLADRMRIETPGAGRARA